MRHSRNLLKTDDERRIFDRGLSVEPQIDTWRLLGGTEQGTLFPVRKSNPIPRAEEDRLVLSGAAGLSLANFRSRFPLLARRNTERYGFRTFNEACSFVGAYVVSSLVKAEQHRLDMEHPFFTYINGGVQHRVTVGASFHGDFYVSDKQTILSSDIVSPINTYTEFAPVRTAGAAGYHSVEPEIVASILEAEFLIGGKACATSLLMALCIS